VVFFIGKGLAAGFHLGLDRIPHQLEFFLDQRRRRLEAMGLVETIQQQALDLLGWRRRIPPTAARARLLQLVERFKASVLANSSSIKVSCGASIKLAVVSERGILPGRVSLA